MLRHIFRIIFKDLLLYDTVGTKLKHINAFLELLEENTLYSIKLSKIVPFLFLT